MGADGVTILPQLFDWLQLVQHELLLFAAFWFLVGAADELAVDLIWVWLWLTRRAGAEPLPPGMEKRPLSGRAAVLVPTWHEDQVIGHMIAHTLTAWPQDGLVLYVGCYRNDPATIEAVLGAAHGDPRVRVVINDKCGPTTKADNLNSLYRALERDEVRSGLPFSSVIQHDAEDMVHPAALAVIDRALAEVDFVQLPVRPEVTSRRHWISGHYCDEFTENHAKAMVVRDALGTAIPAAGVGCGFARSTLARLAAMRVADGGEGPFAAECLTEDYEMGVLVYRAGGKSRFLRLRDQHGQLVATRAYFPDELEPAVRQKARWIHGIALQSWDRLGWSGRPLDMWMSLRDRHGPLTAAVLAVALLFLVVELALFLARLGGWEAAQPMPPLLTAMLSLSFIACIWRLAWRFGFTAREYGMIEGFRSIYRVVVANYVAILAGRRALVAYIGVLRGEIVRWDKTAHTAHPAMHGHAAIKVMAP